MAATTQTVERTSESPHLRVGERLRVLIAHREILANLIRRELKVKYVASVLGAVWSLLNPLVYLAVFTFVTRVLGNGLPDYPVYLLSGLLAWNLFSASTIGGSRSVIDNANLVKKVAFPREILPLAAIGVALVDYGLQMIVLLIFIVATVGLHVPDLALLPLAFAALLVFTCALTAWIAALNVRYRDVGHLLNIGLLVWFWVTPIVYASGLVQQHLEGRDVLKVLYFCNPLTAVVEGMHRALYGLVELPDGGTATWNMPLGTLTLVLVAVLVGSMIFLRFTWGSFFARSGDFAEEL
ncbi:MAG TPA: ABC transporter permease [Actinomycetota bacterium]|nr:ABC transporter permease [Actinomycetota bacterium]